MFFRLYIFNFLWLFPIYIYINILISCEPQRELIKYSSMQGSVTKNRKGSYDFAWTQTRWQVAFVMVPTPAAVSLTQAPERSVEQHTTCFFLLWKGTGGTSPENVKPRLKNLCIFGFIR